MQILNAAKKYQLISLLMRCRSFIKVQLDSNNACTMLEHCRFFNEGELVKTCLKHIEQKTEEVFNSSGFKGIAAETLSLILDSNSFSIMEIELFKHCYEWAVKRGGNESNESNVRKELGEILFKIRFPTMTAVDFADIVCPTNVLTESEQLEILRYISSETKTKAPEGFCCDNRKLGNVTYIIIFIIQKL